MNEKGGGGALRGMFHKICTHSPWKLYFGPTHHDSASFSSSVVAFILKKKIRLLRNFLFLTFVALHSSLQF